MTVPLVNRDNYKITRQTARTNSTCKTLTIDQRVPFSECTQVRNKVSREESLLLLSRAAVILVISR